MCFHLNFGGDVAVSADAKEAWFGDDTLKLEPTRCSGHRGLEHSLGVHVKPLDREAFEGIAAFRFKHLHAKVHRRRCLEEFCCQQVDGIALQKQQSRQDAKDAAHKNQDRSEESDALAVFAFEALAPRHGVDAQALNIAEVARGRVKGCDDEFVALFVVER